MISFSPKTDCPLCGENPRILTLQDKSDWEIHTPDLHEASFELIDIREFLEVHREPYGKPCLNMPMSSFDPHKLESQFNYAIFCQKGKRSAHLVRMLREQGMKNVFSLAGGIEALQKTN